MFYYLYRNAARGAGGLTYYGQYDIIGGCRDVHPWGCRVLHLWGAEFFTPYYIQTYCITDLSYDKTEEGYHNERSNHNDAGVLV